MRSATLDRMAVGLSGLCVLHCIASVVVVSVVSALGDTLGSPAVHRIGLAAAVILAGIALGQGYRAHRAVTPALVGLAGIALMVLGLVVAHGALEVAATVAGVTVLAVGHLMNARVRA